MKVLVLIVLSLLPLSRPVRAAPDSLPDFKPALAVKGDVKIWGSPADGALIASWEEGFRKFNPEAHVIATLHGPDSTLAGVYTGAADLAFMAREILKPVEHMAFTWVFHYPPFAVAIASSGVNTDRLCAALAIFVHKQNPISKMTLAQLDAIFGAEHRRGAKNIRFWEELGLEGSWAGRPIHVYGPPVTRVDALYFRDLVLNGSRKWNPDYWELPETGRDILNLIAKDPVGITYAPLKGANKGVKPLALSPDEDGPFVDLTQAAVASQAYPLTRSVTMVLNRVPGTPVEPRIKEFLRFILSQQGQETVTRDGGYVPLNTAALRKQLQLLD